MTSLIKLNGTGKNVLFPELPSLFDDFITRDFFNVPVRALFNGNSIPAVNVKETNSAFELEMAAPGMSKNEFKIGIENNMLVISAQKENKTEETNEDGTYSRKEFSYQAFKREFKLPENLVNEDEISASYTDGILHILVPKKVQLKPKQLKEITVL